MTILLLELVNAFIFLLINSDLKILKTATEECMVDLILRDNFMKSLIFYINIIYFNTDYLMC